MNRQQVLNLLRTGTPADRIEFVKNLPPNGFKDATLGLIGSDNPSAVIIALAPLAQQYAYGSDPACGAVLAAALHERAVEITRQIPDHGLIATTLSGLACSHVKALTLLGRSREVLDATEDYIKRYEALGETENLPSLAVLRAEALVNLKRLDDAREMLQDAALLQHPIAGIEARRLKAQVERLMADATGLPSSRDPEQKVPSAQDLLAMMKTAIGIGFEGEQAEELKRHVDRLDPGNRLDTSDPEQYRQMLETLGDAEKFFTRGGDDSDVAVRAKIRNASAIFVHGTPAPDVIERSLAELEAALAWAKVHAVTELENDALWGIYLCNSRLDRPSQAADALIVLRGNLEALRHGISNPLKRGGIFTTYPYLFNALCEKLHAAGRAADLLEAIESSKGRVIADKLTEQTGEVVDDPAIYGCVARLPELTKSEGFHYLTYFVDDERVYAAFVCKHGDVHLVDPVDVGKTALRDAAAGVSPRIWGRPKKHSASEKYVNVSEHLAPLVACLDELLEAGIVDEGDHICYSSDEDFHNIPLHYLVFRDGLLLDRFSVSRVHSAFHLDHVLARGDTAPPERFVGFAVPSRQDLAKADGATFADNLDAPANWLAGRLDGTAIRHEDATLERVLSAEPLDHRIIHFATHGWFPEGKESPFGDSFLALASAAGLPNLEAIARGDRSGALTPRAVLESALEFDSSHVSMMACVSGLAKEGIGGDALGLDWAFIQNGASSLVSTHWKVSAACAARFFERFYEKWIDGGMPRAAAWREAMRDLLEGARTPAALQQWAAFSLTGDFR